MASFRLSQQRGELQRGRGAEIEGRIFVRPYYPSGGPDQIFPLTEQMNDRLEIGGWQRVFRNQEVKVGCPQAGLRFAKGKARFRVECSGSLQRWQRRKAGLQDRPQVAQSLQA